MKALTIRNVPDDLYRDLKELARRNRRSLQQQILVLLERVRVGRPPSAVQRAAEIRARLAGRDLGDTVAELCAERER